MRLIDGKGFNELMTMKVTFEDINKIDRVLDDAVERMMAEITKHCIPIDWIENWKRGKTSIEQVVADKIMVDYKHRDWEKENE